MPKGKGGLIVAWKSVVSLSRLPYLVLHSESYSFYRTRLIKSIMAQAPLKAAAKQRL